MVDIQRPLHATVKWKVRCTRRRRNSRCTGMVHGKWSAATKTATWPTGRSRSIAMDTALACMYAIQAEPKDDDH